MPEGGMQISPEQGQLMAFLVEALGVRRALEVGVFTGYSSTRVALSMPEDGRLVAWAWATNGCASVIGASLAIVGAMSGGFTAVALAALAVYGAGVLVLPVRATET